MERNNNFFKTVAFLAFVIVCIYLIVSLNIRINDQREQIKEYYERKETMQQQQFAEEQQKYGKSELFKNKLIARFLKMLGGYPVNREGNDVSAVKTTLSLLKNHETITIFPEGTRGDTGELNALKNGLAMFALKTDAYVIPMCFKKKPKLFVFNTLLIGEPFKFSDLEEFKDQKVTRELIDMASSVLSKRMTYLKEISIKEFKKTLKVKK